MARVYPDACMVIDLVEGNADQQKTLKLALKGQDIVSSELTRLESLIGALRSKHGAYLETYRKLFLGCTIIPMDRAVFELATDLRVQYAIKTPDALHLAAALHGGCAEFWTNDKRLAVAAGNHVSIVTWSDLGRLPAP